MKNIKKFEYLEPEIKKLKEDFFLNLDKSVKYFFYSEHIYSKSSYDYLRFKLLENDNLFLEFEFQITNWVFQIRINPIYTDIDIWKETLNFKKYFCSIIEPLSFSHDADSESYEFTSFGNS